MVRLGLTTSRLHVRYLEQMVRVVMSELHDAIWKRDRVCIGTVHDRSHRCSGKRTIDHFWHRPQGVKGKRAPSDELHLVAMCEELNVWRTPSHDLRMFEREYIARYYRLDLEALLRGDYEVA